MASNPRAKKLLTENGSGIYVFHRVDPETKKISAYIGQAKNLLNRCAQHFMQYDHLGLSLKAHNDWIIQAIDVPLCDLDKVERELIADYKTRFEFDLYNITGGGQRDKAKYIKKSKAARILFRTKPYNQSLEIYNCTGENCVKGRHYRCNMDFRSDQVQISVDPAGEFLVKMPKSIPANTVFKCLELKPYVTTVWEKAGKCYVVIGR